MKATYQSSCLWRAISASEQRHAETVCHIDGAPETIQFATKGTCIRAYSQSIEPFRIHNDSEKLIVAVLC
eukprot:2604567-Pleurochrysis_carterae.AAC.2